jgi:hypothetical protein
MKYKIFDKINKEYLDLTKYCVNGFGDVMTINGIVPMNQNDFKIELVSEFQKCILCGNGTGEKNLKVCNKCASEYEF